MKCEIYGQSHPALFEDISKSLNVNYKSVGTLHNFSIVICKHETCDIWQFISSYVLNLLNLTLRKTEDPGWISHKMKW